MRTQKDKIQKVIVNRKYFYTPIGLQCVWSIGVLINSGRWKPYGEYYSIEDVKKVLNRWSIVYA